MRTLKKWNLLNKSLFSRIAREYKNQTSWTFLANILVTLHYLPIIYLASTRTHFDFFTGFFKSILCQHNYFHLTIVCAQSILGESVQVNKSRQLNNSMIDKLARIGKSSGPCMEDHNDYVTE